MSDKGRENCKIAQQREWKNPEKAHKLRAKMKQMQITTAKNKVAKSRLKPINQNSRGLQRIRLVERDGNKCTVCGLPPAWNNKPLVFQVHDHKTDPKLVCPNCHSQTEGFCHSRARSSMYNPCSVGYNSLIKWGGSK